MAAYMRNVTHQLHRCLTVRGLASLQYPKQPVRCISSSTATSQESDGPSDSPVSISDSCVKQLQRLKESNGEEDKFLRVSVEGGGCSGFQCIFNLDTQLNQEEDRIIEKDGVKVVIDDITLGYIKGATIDYHQELIRSAFRITNIPSAEKGCSCGASFSLKL